MKKTELTIGSLSMENKILSLLMAGVLMFSLCSCGASKSQQNMTISDLPVKVVTRVKKQKGQTYQFEGMNCGKTVTYTMTREGENDDVNHVPDKIFAPLLADQKKGITNIAVMTLLNYQWTSPEWSAYYFHNILFSFSNAVLDRKADTFQIKRKTGSPFFVGKVSLGKNGLPANVSTNILVTSSENGKTGWDHVNYQFFYNEQNNIDHVDFKEHADWKDFGSAKIDVDYGKDGKTIHQISKTETNSLFQTNEFAYRPVYKNQFIRGIDIIKDSTKLARLSSHARSVRIMTYSDPVKDAYTGFAGSRYEKNPMVVAKSGHIKHSTKEERQKEPPTINTETKYKYQHNKNLIKKLIVTDAASIDNRTYTYIHS